MRIKVDRSGRIMLPKMILESLGLAPGASLEIEIEEGTAWLRPVSGNPLLVERSGVLVFEGVALEGMSESVNKLREARICHLDGEKRPSKPE